VSALTLCGWIVVHALWQCTFIGGAAALALGLLRNARADARDRAAAISLALMAIAPVLTALSSTDLLGPVTRRPILMAIDRTIPMPIYLEWRSMMLSLVGGLWILGTTVCLFRIAAAWRAANSLRANHEGDAAEDTRASVDELREVLSLDTPVDVRRSAAAHVPMVLGWRRPVILLPNTALAALTSAELRAVLAHELAHVARRDYLANLLQLLAESVIFFHPAARWVARRIRVEREYCCDDAAIRVAGDRAVYAHALAALDDARSDCRLAVAAVSGTLVDRIARIAGRPRGFLTGVRGALVMVAATAVAAALIALTFALPPTVPPGAKVRSQRPPAGAGIHPPGNALPLQKQRQPR
jgi:beta-lactamase regulating signal transducer with metallopeptidase domain